MSCARNRAIPRGPSLSLTSCEGTRRGWLVYRRRRGRLRLRHSAGSGVVGVTVPHSGQRSGVARRS